MKWVLEIVDEFAMPDALNAAILRGLCEAFPEDCDFFSRARGWHGSWPRFSVVALDEGGGVLGQVGIVERRVTVGGNPFTVGGAQNVFVTHKMRGTGLAAVLMREAMEECSRRGYDCGLLFCSLPLEKVYAAMGWMDVGKREVVRREDGRLLPLPENNISMMFPLKPSVLPAGILDLQGNDW